MVGQGRLRSHRGPSTTRRSAWQRVRWRRGLAALLAGSACWVALGIFSPTPPAGVTVLVARSTLPTGHVLADGDVERRVLPSSAAPRSAVTDAGTVAGRPLAAPVDAGEVLTAARIGSGARLDGHPPGTRAVHVPLADPAALGRVARGDRVDVVAVVDGTVVVASAVVLDLDAADGGLLEARARGVTLAVPEARVGPLTIAALDPAGRGGVHIAQRA